ncbi:MAG: carboxyl transferase domain-containing protein [Myxococcota bacterium]
MSVLDVKLRPGSAEFERRRRAMESRLAEVRDREEKVRCNSARARDRFRKRGALLPRERLERLLDRGRAFLELSALAGLEMHDDDGDRSAAGGGVIVGLGWISGVRCVITASDSGIKGGSTTPMGLKKSLRAQQVALDNRLPLVNLIESGGANLLYQSEIFVDGGAIFRNLARLSAAGIPTLSVVHGSSTAGGAYMPGLSDYVVVVRDRSKIFLAGPPLVKAATGEIADDEALGGAAMHAEVTGSAEFIAEDDDHAIQVARDIIGRLGWANLEQQPAYREPRFDPDELIGVVPDDPKTPYDVREVIARLIDDSDFLDFKSDYGPAMVCGKAEIEGITVGVLGNNGPIDADGAAKAAHFIQLCSQSGSPLIYLQNTTGYMVGLEAEHSGIVKHGSRMIQAVSNAAVPQLTLLIGSSYGAGNYGMCGRAFGPRFIFAWPNNRIAVMGGEQAAGVMSIITEAKFERMGQKLDRAALAAMKKGIVDQIDRESTALYATARLWDDGIIDPRHSRRVLATCLRICDESKRRDLQPTSFGIGRV